jgi:membrane protein DedA with SNARE-associated domain
MPWPRFVLFNAIGAAAWVGVWTTAGYLAGDHLSAITATIHRYQLWAIAAGVLAVTAHLLRRARRRAARPRVRRGVTRSRCARDGLHVRSCDLFGSRQ